MSAEFIYSNGCIYLWPTPVQDLSTISDQEINELPPIESITVPFHYWAPESRDKLPCYANVFRWDNYPLDLPDKKNTPDLIGRLTFPIPAPASDTTNREQLGTTLYRINKLFTENSGYHSLLFKAFVPFSTRSIKDIFKSLFPFLGNGRENLSRVGNHKSICISIINAIPFLILDICTIAFRILTFVPRIIYQHCLKKHSFSIQSDIEVNWNKGSVQLFTTHSQRVININQHPPSFYLG